MLRRFRSVIQWLGLLLIIVGLIIVLVILPGWFWCAVAALTLIIVGVILLRPVFKR